ncbi:lactoylglutathione lyase [Streptomyces sp. 1222.5]|uniref:VOC family protein n=1 Tax=unclassified Streptomyces TaxID=2593676 RepID=UPI0008974B52|nr:MULTISPECIES: VOC family protein [unclassified Streptomyces]PKW07843.1 lactoylglutathione lyase [Streptomyces sp. 5112.2]SEC78438.1 lactoylglutathione lyase [Streptomyces sp. 1222.5]
MTLRTAHIGLNVTDLDRSLAFYRDVLGFALLAEGKEDDRRYAFLGDGGDQPVLTLWQQARAPYEGGRAGLHHLALAADSVDRVREYETALRAAGVDFAHEGVVAHREGSASGGLFFHDPDGTRLEISVPHGAEGAPAPHGSAPTCGFF